jgi:hypothetical protein
VSKKTGTKQEQKRRKQRAIKNQIKQRGKDNKTLSQKSEKGREKIWQNDKKKKEPKIKILTYELLTFTLSYLMLSPW